MTRNNPKIAILGWGSLLWDIRPEFDEYHELWQFDGPDLPLEFSRVSSSRKGALTLVIDEANGATCRSAYALSTHREPDEAIADLRCREGTLMRHRGVHGRPRKTSPTRSTSSCRSTRSSNQQCSTRPRPA